MRKEYTEEDLFDFADYYYECAHGFACDVVIKNWKETRQKSLEVKKKSVSLCDEWIDEWCSLWPIGIKSQGKPIKSDTESCRKRMNDFLKTYKYDKETIFKATQDYISERETFNFEYTRKSIFFIGKKGEGSDLATWCDLVINEDKIDLNSNYDRSFI
jgi:hypothetical protein